MCLIIERPKKTVIPFEKFSQAVENNGDGYGLAFPDEGGKLYVQRSADTPNAEELWKFLHEELKEEKVLVHLRYTTAGETSLRNAHPFPILEQEKDGVDLRMAHNGTITKYKEFKSPLSDTRFFVQRFVRPLFKRLVRGWDVDEVLTDPFVAKLLEDQIPSSSVLSFIDGNGNTLQVNPTGNGGYYDDDTGIWYSNKYSFDADHRKPKTNYYGPGYSYGNTQRPLDRGTGKSGGTDFTKGSREDHALDTQQQYFTEKYECDIDDIYSLTDETLDHLVKEEPDECLLLLKELINEHRKLSRHLKSVTDATKKNS